MKIKYHKVNWKYILDEEYSIQIAIYDIRIKAKHVELSTTGLLIIHADFGWDGASGPAIDTPDFMRPSLVHDALYYLMRLGLLDIKRRKYSDKLLVELCKEEGMAGWRRWYVYWAVRWGGKKYAEPKPPA